MTKQVRCTSHGSERPNLPRISVLCALVTTSLLTAVGCARHVVESRTEDPKKIVNVRDFGAKGDGETDDYEALQAAASALCKSAGATLLFPEGTYRIDRYRISSGPKANKVQNIRFVGCNGNTITGVRAKIEVNGAFRRSADRKEDTYSISYADSVVPFEMIQSSGFRIIGFELDGNVEKMSRDPKVAIGGAAGILTSRCRDYYIEDVTIRGFGGDGIRLGDDPHSADQGVHLINVSSTNNARQGLAIVNLRGGDVINSVFSNNGRTGSYGSHAPAAGVALEPIRYTSEEDPSGDITFDRCRFEENVGPQFFSGRPDLVDSITIKSSYMKSTLPDTGETAFMSAAKTSLVQGNTFDIASGRGFALAPYSPDSYGSLNQITYRNNTFNLGNNKGLIAPVQPAPVELVDNNIRVNSREKDSTLLRLDYLKLVDNNSIFEANSGYSGLHPTILYEKGSETVRNNRYQTDRTDPGGFDVYYGPDTQTSGEIYQNPASFKRYYSATTK